MWNYSCKPYHAAYNENLVISVAVDKTNKKEIKKRPVVVIKESGNYVSVLKITSRNKDDEFHVRMNNFIIHGFCDISHIYKIERRYLLRWMRNCTSSEVEAIEEKLNSR